MTLAVWLAGVAWFCSAQTPAPAPQTATLQGQFIVEEQKPPRLESAGNTIVLGSARRSVRDTLQDRRISGKTIRVVGSWAPDGTFQVDEFYSVHPDGKEYRVVYFCRTCNITRFSPGRCECCQEPTQPIEIPPTDPRVSKK